jgi:hypothetical protein
VIVAQGTKADGHVGRMASMALVPMVAQSDIPFLVFAAGGIARWLRDGRRSCAGCRRRPAGHAFQVDGLCSRFYYNETLRSSKAQPSNNSTYGALKTSKNVEDILNREHCLKFESEKRSILFAF